MIDTFSTSQSYTLALKGWDSEDISISMTWSIMVNVGRVAR